MSESALHLDLELTTVASDGGFGLALAWATEETSLAIFGHSGAGKTTVLEAIAGLRPDVHGHLRIGEICWLDSERGIHLAPELRNVGYVPQDTLLFPHRDVRANVAAGHRRAARAQGRRLDVDRVLTVLDLGGLERRAVTTLSGGERQRVALARALCSGADLLLLDEPVASLDLALRRRILPYLLRVREEFRLPALYVSHDVHEVAALAREVLVLQAGRAVARGAPEDVLAGDAPFAAASGGERETLLRGTAVESRGGSTAIELEPGLRVFVGGAGLGGEVIVSLRAADVLIAERPPEGISAQNVLAGRIETIRAEEHDEAESTLVTLTLGSGRVRLIAAITHGSRERLGLAVGRSVYAVFKAQACRVLGAR